MAREFHARFACAKPQMHPLMDLFANLMRNSYDHFLPSGANLVVSGTLDFITSLVVDHDLQNMQVHLCLKFVTTYFDVRRIFRCTKMRSATRAGCAP